MCQYFSSAILRMGKFDVLSGVNLRREGLDIVVLAVLRVRRARDIREI